MLRRISLYVTTATATLVVYLVVVGLYLSDTASSEAARAVVTGCRVAAGGLAIVCFLALSVYLQQRSESDRAS